MGHLPAATTQAATPIPGIYTGIRGTRPGLASGLAESMATGLGGTAAGATGTITGLDGTAHVAIGTATRPDGIQGSVAGTGEPFLEVAGMWRHCQTNMGRLVTVAVGWCLASSALAQLPQDHLTSRQSREKQFDHSRRQLEQQQQLNLERFRAEHGWQLHPRPQAPWEERRREDELRKEFQRGRQPPSP